MKIKQENNITYFEDVKVGEVFKNNGKMYLRIITWSDGDCDYNVLDLETYDLIEKFDPYDSVIVYSRSELIIK